MNVTIDISEYELEDYLWSGGKETWREIVEKDKETDFFDYIEDLFTCDPPTITEINDLLWFERDTVLKDIGVYEYNECMECKGEYPETDTIKIFIQTHEEELKEKHICLSCAMNKYSKIYEEYKE